MQDDRGVFTTRSAERSSHSSLRPRSTLPAQPLATSAAADATKSTWKTSETSFLSPLVSRAPVGAANLIEASPMGPLKMSSGSSGSSPGMDASPAVFVPDVKSPRLQVAIMEAYGAEASPMMAFREDKSEAACESPIMTYAHRRAFNRDVLAEAAILTDIYTATAVESSESESEDEQIQESSEMDGASTMVVLHNLALASSKMSEVCRASDHLQRLESGFEGFKCGCARARAKGQQSCLDDFSKVQLRTLHTETYGPPNKDISVA